MWLFFGALFLICIVLTGWFMPLPGLYGGNEFISNITLWLGGLFGGLAIIGYYDR